MIVINMFSIKSGGDSKVPCHFCLPWRRMMTFPVLWFALGGGINTVKMKKCCGYRWERVYKVFSFFSFLHAALVFDFFRFVIDVYYSPPPIFSSGERTVSGFAYSDIIQSDIDFC